MNDDEGSLILSREDLYELVWSKPMLELAKDFEISDVALAKRCKRLAIPVPGRGYWARIDAGQTPYQPNLPKRDEEWGDHHALTLPASGPDPAKSEANETSGECESLSSIRARIAAVAITPVSSVVSCTPAIMRTARQLKHRRRTEFVFERGEQYGPVVSMDVSEATLDRACVLADVLLRFCEALGWPFTATPHPEPEPQRGSYGYRSAEPPPSPSAPRVGELT